LRGEIMAMLFRPKSFPRRYKNLAEKIKQDKARLDMICNVYRGIWTGVLHVFVVDESIINEWHLEKEALRPILRGKDIGPFRYKWAGKWVIYTQQKDFEKRFPNVIKYLEQFRVILERRSAVWIYGKKWWELEDPLSPQMFEIEKIMSPYISRFNAFTYEEGKFYAMDSTVIIRFWYDLEELRDYITKWRDTNEPSLDVEKFLQESEEILRDLGKSRETLLYLLGILNSDLIEFYYKLYAQRVTKRGSRQPKGKYFLYVPPYLNVLPISIADRSERRDIVRQVLKICGVAKELSEVEEGSEEKKIIEERVSELVGELNEKIYDLYGLDEDEKAIVQNFVLRKR